MKNWFNFKLIRNVNQRTFGFIIRILGVDFSLLMLGWLSDWKLISLEAPINYGVYFQTFGLVSAIGRLPTETYEAD